MHWKRLPGAREPCYNESTCGAGKLLLTGLCPQQESYSQNIGETKGLSINVCGTVVMLRNNQGRGGIRIKALWLAGGAIGQDVWPFAQ